VSSSRRGADLLPKQRSTSADDALIAPGHGPRHAIHIDRYHLRGEEFRSKLRLPGRSLLPSSAFEHVAAF
jgi:hypothetical protein